MKRPLIAIAGIAAILALLWLASPSEREMQFGADSGALYPGTGADDTTVGTLAWTNPTNITATDDANATRSGSGTTHYLKATNFSFSIPAGATIDGILVEIEKKKTQAGNSGLQDSAIRIVKADGSIGTTNKSTGASWSTTESFISYGGAADLWGETWTSTDINDADFGAVISAELLPDITVTAHVDSFRITVTYTEAAAVSTNGTVKVQSATIKVNGGTVKVN